MWKLTDPCFTRTQTHISNSWPPNGISELQLIYIARQHAHSKLTQNKSVSFYFLFYFHFRVIFGSLALPSFLSVLSRAWLILFYPRANFQAFQPSQAKPNQSILCIKVSVWVRVCVSNAELNLRSLETQQMRINTPFSSKALQRWNLSNKLSNNSSC